MSFEITLLDGSIEVVDGATGYSAEGPMTTFFADESGRLSPWASRLASYRTEHLSRIKQVLA